jgi:hypothetical protein
MGRKLVWIKEASFQGYACSLNAMAVKPFCAATGRSLEEMKHSFELQRNKEPNTQETGSKKPDISKYRIVIARL